MRDPTASPLWRELVRAGAEGHLVALVGAGASVPAGLPRWDELLDELFRRAHDDAFPEQQAHLRAAQEFERSERAEALARVMGRRWLEAAIVGRLSVPSLQPTHLHQGLVALPDTRLLTTNYDTLLEQAAQAIGRPLPVVTAVDAAELAGDRPMLFKLHGCVTRPETIVLTVADRDGLRHRSPAAWRDRLKSYLQPPSCLVMVGYGFGDSNIQGVLAELRAAYEDHLPGPIWIEVRSAGAGLRAQTFGLRQLPIEDYDDLAPLLGRLGEAIKSSRARPPAIVGPLLDVASEHLDECVQQARAHLDAGDYAAAQERLEQALARAEILAGADPEDKALRCELARARLNRGAAHLLVGQRVEGRALLERVEAGALVARPQALAQLACAWVELDEPARARQVLECVAGECADADRAALDEARQRVAIAEGTLPEELLTPRLRLRAARVLMLRNRLDQAVGLARDAFRQAQDDRWLAADALPLLVYCLERSVHENPPADEPVAVSARAEILEVVEAALSTIDKHRFPPPTAEELAHWRARFFGLTHDDERWFDAPVAAGATGEAASQVGSSAGGVTPLALALERAKAGHTQEALDLLEDERHPWLPALHQALLLRRVGRLDQAIALLERSAEAAPGSYGIELVLAESYLEREQPQQALPHARLAYQALPGRGARLALAGALVGVARDLETDRGLLEEAWALLEPMAPSRGPLTLRLRAQVATLLARPDAVALWEACLAASPGNHGVADRLHMARALWRSARGTEAAEAAWRAFELGAEQLTPQGLGACARFQFAGPDPGREAVARAKAIDRALRRRFPGDLEAEQVHARIAAMLGFPADLAPVDFPALVASGAARSLDLDELTSLLAAQRTRAEDFGQLYRAGLITTERFCRETHIWPAEFLARVRAAAGWSDEVFLATPVGPRVDPMPELKGCELLAGELELLILQHLGLRDALRRALGPDGKVVVFDDVMAAVERSAATLTLSAGAGALPREQALDKLLWHHARVRREPPESAESAEALAERHDLALVAPARPGGTVAWVSLRALLALMLERGLLRADAAHGALGALPDDGARIEAFPPRIVVSWAVLETLHQLEGLEPLLREVQELWLPGEAERLRGRRLDELERAAEAARMATDLHRWLAAGHGQGWVARLPRPEAEVLPKGPADAQPNALRAILRQELQQALHWRLALEGHPRRILLTADFLVAALFTGAAPLPVLRQVGWTPAAYRALDERITRLLPRQITIAELVSSLDADPASPQWTKPLAELGFQQALPAQALVRLQDEYGQLHGGEAARLLDRSEWVARAAGHPGQKLARLALARSYADAIWLAWKGAGQGHAPEGAKAMELSEVLLARAANLDDAQPVGGVLDQLLQLLAAAVSSEPLHALRADPAESSDSVAAALVLAEKTPAGELWRFLSRWAQGGHARHSAVERAVTQMLCFCDEQWEGRQQAEEVPRGSPVHAWPLTLWCPAAASQDLRRPAVDALLILSARWPEQPLENVPLRLIVAGGAVEFSFRQVFTEALALLADRRPGIVERAGRWEIPIARSPGGPVAVHVPIPPEALLLRAPPALVPLIAETLAVNVGVHDGRLVALLAELRQRPEDDKLRGRFARAAAAASWRLVRDDPRWITAWGLQQRGPRTLADLRALLSEPAPLGAQSATEALQARVQGQGSWAARTDVQRLARLASEVPGDLTMAPLPWRLEQDVFATEVEQAIQRLEHAAEQPVARLMGDIVFLRVAAATQSQVSTARREVDLREALPPLLADVLEAEMPTGTTTRSARPPEPALGDMADGPLPIEMGRVEASSVGETEVHLLRLCRDAVFRLARASDELFDLQEGLWLTWRLRQWLEAQLAELTPDERVAGLAALRAAAVVPHPGVNLDDADVLDPQAYAPDGRDFRLAAIVYGLNLMEDGPLASLVPATAAGPPARRVYSARLGRALRTLASRPLEREDLARMQRQNTTPSRLGWTGPWTVPELALNALLHLDLSSFGELTPEVQRRWLGLLPRGPADARRLTPSTTRVLLGAVSCCAEGLGDVGALRLREAIATAVAETPELRAVGALALMGLFRAGVEGTEAEIVRLLAEARGSDLWYRLTEYWLAAVAATLPERVEATYRGLAREATDSAMDPVPLLLAFARVIFVAPPEHAPRVRGIVAALAREEPYCHDQRVAEMVGSLALGADEQ